MGRESIASTLSLNESTVVFVNIPHDIVPVEIKVAAGGGRDTTVSLWVGKDVHDYPCITVFVRWANIAVNTGGDGGSRAGAFQKYGGRSLAGRFNLH